MHRASRPSDGSESAIDVQRNVHRNAHRNVHHAARCAPSTPQDLDDFEALEQGEETLAWLREELKARRITSGNRTSSA